MKNVLITGASRGIGRATAELFAQEGWGVAIHYHQRQQEAFSLVKALGKTTQAECFQANIGCPQDVQRLATEVLEAFGHIDALVNNAGIAGGKLFTELTNEEWREMFAVNIDGMFYLSRALLPQMIRRQEGVIVNLSSIWGLTGASCEVHYSASKAAVIGLTKALAKEVGPSGIRVNCVAPGIVDTEMNAKIPREVLNGLIEETPLERLGTPQEVGELIYYLCSDKSKFITGQVISPNGGFVI